MVVAAVVAVLFLRPAPAPKTQVLPRFRLETLAGGSTLSNLDLKGHPAVINFWASWCGPCNAEAPALEAAWQRYKGDGVMVLGVDVKDVVPSAKAFVQKHKVTYPIVRDPDQKLAQAMGVGIGLPQTFFVDASGTVVPGSGLGQIDTAQLNQQIGALLGGSGGATP